MIIVAKEKNHCLDFLKGIACFCVVFIHIHFPGITGEAVQRLSGYAVPVFFMISGYFAYYTNSEATRTNVTRRLKRIFKLSLWASALYGVLRLVLKIAKGTLVPDFTIEKAIDAVINFLLLNDLDGITGGGHLWFLWALVYAYIYLLIINKYHAWQLAYVIMVVLFVGFVGLQGLGFYENLSWHYSGNWVVNAIPFVTLGHFIASHKNKWLSISNFNYTLLAVFGSIISLYRLCGTNFQTRHDFSEAGIVILSAALFMLALKNPTSVWLPSLETIGRKYSLYIYIFHIMVAAFVGKLLKTIGLMSNTVVTWIYPLLIAGITLIISIGFVKCQQMLLNRK